MLAEQNDDMEPLLRQRIKTEDEMVEYKIAFLLLLKKVRGLFYLLLSFIKESISFAYVYCICN